MSAGENSGSLIGPLGRKRGQGRGGRLVNAQVLQVYLHEKQTERSHQITPQEVCSPAGLEVDKAGALILVRLMHIPELSIRHTGDVYKYRNPFLDVELSRLLLRRRRCCSRRPIGGVVVDLQADNPRPSDRLGEVCPAAVAVLRSRRCQIGIG